VQPQPVLGAAWDLLSHPTRAQRRQQPVSSALRDAQLAGDLRHAEFFVVGETVEQVERGQHRLHLGHARPVIDGFRDVGLGDHSCHPLMVRAIGGGGQGRKA
jgi:hypothetical protein